MPDIKDHDLNCDECREFTNDANFQKAYQAYIDNNLRKTLKEEWQTTVTTITRVDRIEKILYWLITSQILQIAVLGAILIFIIKK